MRGYVNCNMCCVVKDCGMQLTDEPDKRCYPLHGVLLCQCCHLQRLNDNYQAAMSSDDAGSCRSQLSSSSGHVSQWQQHPSELVVWPGINATTSHCHFYRSSSLSFWGFPDPSDPQVQLKESTITQNGQKDNNSLIDLSGNVSVKTSGTHAPVLHGHWCSCSWHGWPPSVPRYRCYVFTNSAHLFTR